MSDVIKTISSYTGMGVDKIKAKIRERAINNAMASLTALGKSPFQIGEERFEILVEGEEAKLISKIKTIVSGVSVGALALSYLLPLIGLDR